MKSAIFQVILIITLCVSSLAFAGDLPEYWPNRVPAVALDSSSWLQRLAREECAEARGCELEANYDGHGRVSLTLTKTSKGQAGADGRQSLRMCRRVLWDDLLFNARWHAGFPIGATILFCTDEGWVYGYSSTLGYDYGWSRQVVPDETGGMGEYLSTLRRGDRIERTLDVFDGIRGFNRAFPEVKGKKGHYWVIVRVPILEWQDDGWTEIDCLYRRIRIPKD